ncbi:MAG: DUF559 domain-containing protein [Rhodocyclaceae bacterium]|nr:DUF559 domain-containing protein [Rhodocyclaceae bacterium]
MKGGGVRWSEAELLAYRVRCGGAPAAPKTTVRQDTRSEAEFHRRLVALGVPEWERNHRIDRSRRYEADFAWPDRKIAVEIDGQAHCIRTNMARDRRKDQWVRSIGWVLLRYCPEQVADGTAAAEVAELLFGAK